VSSGIHGLDEILSGGFLRGRTYLITGSPGTGKTTLGFHFLTAAPSHAKTLCVTLTETEEHLREQAASLDINVGSIAFLDLTAGAEMFTEVQSYDIFSPSEVEREPISKSIQSRIEQLSPDRIFIDGFSQLRTISSDVFHFLRLVQSFFRLATAQGATVLVSATKGMTDGDVALEASTDGIIRLRHCNRLRTLEVIKMRGSNFSPGRHPMRITSSGVETFPESR